MKRLMTTKLTGLERRRLRIKKKVRGTTVRPRLSVYRSLKHIYAQIVDDSIGKTIVAASSAAFEDDKKKKTEKAKAVGEAIGKLAIGKGIDKVVFDRSGHAYHGRIKAVAEGARQAGLKF